MWYYYGAKLKLVTKYPKPNFDTIVEPFAGSAQYSLKYFEKNVTLIDKYDVVARIWKWLQLCSEGDILKLPVIPLGKSVNDYTWDCEEARWLIGFNIVMGSYIPRTSPTKWTTTERPLRQSNKLKLIASSLYKIRHWNIVHGDYTEAENVKATWFIDSTYMKGGSLYPHHSIDYNKLRDWSLSRSGEIIVCGNSSDTWLPFTPIATMAGVQHRTVEGMFYRRVNE